MVTPEAFSRRSALRLAAALGLASGTAPGQARPAEEAEPVLDPELPIVDPHHHLWDLPTLHYLFPELLLDLGAGHRVTDTVFVECQSMYRKDGPKALRSLGQTEFANGVAAMSASGGYGSCRAVAGIVGAIDLRLGDGVHGVIAAHRQAAGPRFKGIRFANPWDAAPLFGRTSLPENRRLLALPSVRRGASALAEADLSLDLWAYHPQLQDLADFADAVPNTRIVVDHCGTPLGVGPYGADRQAVFATWRGGVTELAKRPNVVMKLGGLGMNTFGSPYFKRPTPPTSVELANEWQPYIETCIRAFGPNRCMFESNFPVDASTCGYRILWNTFKRLAAGYSDTEKSWLFGETARQAYRLEHDRESLQSGNA